MGVIRRISNELGKSIYLTFDDGPDPYSTKPVLELLEKHSVTATFFLIAEKAEKSPELSAEICAAHAVGNHSLDHKYGAFFRGKRSMIKWIRRSEELLSRVTGKDTVGFRPPAGIRTPELNFALKQLGIPLVLWQRRYFDTVFDWTRQKAIRGLRETNSGDIVLLHDRKHPRELMVFLEALDAYISHAKASGFEFRVLSRAVCAREQSEN